MPDLPIGSIIFWPTDSAPPTGWVRCDGTGGTRNLQGLEVVGAGNGYAVGNAGGSATWDASHGHGIGSTDLYPNDSNHDWTFTFAGNSASESPGSGSTTMGDDTPHTHSAVATYDPVFQNYNPMSMANGTHGHPLSGAYDVTSISAPKLPLSLALYFIQRVS